MPCGSILYDFVGYIRELNVMPDEVIVSNHPWFDVRREEGTK